MALKELPNNQEAEQSVLGSMFLSTYAISKATDALTKESFYFDRNGKIFDCIKNMTNRKIPIDLTTVTTELKENNLLQEIGGVEYLTELLNIVPTAANIEYYIKLVDDCAMLRRLIDVSTEITTNAYGSSLNINETLDEAERKILGIVKNKRSTEFRNIKEVLNSTRANLEKLSKNKGEVTGIPTGWPKIDRVTTGLHENQLIILAARPGVGKTAFALHLATNVAKSAGKSVALFNLEMGAEQLATRMISSLGQIEGHKLASGNLTNDWNRVNEAISQLENANLFLDDTPGITIGEIRSKCRRLATSETGLDLVIIDYLQLITSSTNYGTNRQQEVSDISRSLKMLAMELKIPVIALAQLSRSVEQRKENKRPLLSDLRESGSIEQDADIVAFLYRDDYYDQKGINSENREQEDENVSKVEFIIAKHRNGAVCTIPLKFKRDTSSFFSVYEEKGSERNE